MVSISLDEGLTSTRGNYKIIFLFYNTYMSSYY